MTAPANNAVLSGTTVTLSANASDNVGVAGVQFLLNGSNLGNEDTAAPFGAIWDTTAVANGTYTITAIARDTAGNKTTASPITVQVNNAGSSSGGGNTFGNAVLWVDEALPRGAGTMAPARWMAIACFFPSVGQVAIAWYVSISTLAKSYGNLRMKRQLTRR